MENRRIIFMGTPKIASVVLKTMLENDIHVGLVVTQPDKKKGRKQQLVYSEVKEVALEYDIPVFQPVKIRNDYQAILDFAPDLIVTCAYGQIVPKEVLDLPRYGCVNLHGSLLPKYRGAAPIQWAVINGDKKIGITTMLINEKMEEGDMLLKEEVEIGEDETLGEVWDKLAKIGSKLLVETIRRIEKGRIRRIPQTSVGQEEPSYAPMLDKSIAKINWELNTAQEIKNLIRGLNPIMGAYTFINNKKIKIWKAQVIDEKDFIQQYNCPLEELNKNNYGDVLIADSKKGLFLKAKNGIISILEIQAENAKKMNILDYLRGNTILS